MVQLLLGGGGVFGPGSRHSRCRETGQRTSQQAGLALLPPPALRFLLFIFLWALLKMALLFPNPDHLLMLQTHLTFRLFSAQLSQQTSPHLLLNVSDTVVRAASCRLIPRGFPVESDVIQNFSSVSKATISCILWREIKHTTLRK